MYKIHAALVVVLALVCTAVFKLVLNKDAYITRPA